MRDCGKAQHSSKQLRKDIQHSWKSPVLSSVRPGQEVWDVGAGSGCGRDRQASWDAREMRTATTKVRREVYEDFRKLCWEQGETPYSVLRDFLLAFVDHFGGGGEDEPEEAGKPWEGWHSSG